MDDFISIVLAIVFGAIVLFFGAIILFPIGVMVYAILAALFGTV